MESTLEVGAGRDPVERARARGWSRQDIATRLGVTKQAVHRKHGRRKRG